MSAGTQGLTLVVSLEVNRVTSSTFANGGEILDLNGVMRVGFQCSNGVGRARRRGNTLLI